MPLNSVQQYIKGLINDLPVPGQDKTIEAYITPPTVEDIDRPKAYIWGGRLRGMRQTAPRGPGFKRLNWVVDVYLVWETLPYGPTIDSEFPLIIDAVMNKTWTTKMPIQIQDPQTGQPSQILQIGEEFELEYPPERMPSTLRTLYWTARLGLDVYEAVQA